jgi:hypothetical protein
VKVREGLAANDYRDPGWYNHPQGTVAYELQGVETPPARRARPAPSTPNGVPMKVIKPTGHKGHH